MFAVELRRFRFADILSKFSHPSSGFVVPTRCRELEPLVGDRIVLRHAKTVPVENRKVELAVSEPALRRLRKPQGSGYIVWLAGAGARSEHGKIVHRLNVVLRRRPLIPNQCALDILAHPEAALVERAKAVLRKCKATSRRAPIPFGGFVEILFNAFAIREPAGNLEFR